MLKLILKLKKIYKEEKEMRLKKAHLLLFRVSAGLLFNTNKTGEKEIAVKT